MILEIINSLYVNSILFDINTTFLMAEPASNYKVRITLNCTFKVLIILLFALYIRDVSQWKLYWNCSRLKIIDVIPANLSSSYIHYSRQFVIFPKYFLKKENNKRNDQPNPLYLVHMYFKTVFCYEFWFSWFLNNLPNYIGLSISITNRVSKTNLKNFPRNFQNKK